MFIIELTSLIKTSSQTVILMNIIYIALKTSFKKQHFFELTSLLKMDLTFIIKFAQKLTSLIKMDLTSLFKTSFKKQPSGLNCCATDRQGKAQQLSKSGEKILATTYNL